VYRRPDGPEKNECNEARALGAAVQGGGPTHCTSHLCVKGLACGFDSGLPFVRHGLKSEQ